MAGTSSQFHYGSIKTNNGGFVENTKAASQFHYGSIKTKKSLYKVALFMRLNSTMVRLSRQVGTASLRFAETVRSKL